MAIRDSIAIKGARENNLQNIDISIPRDKLVVITGISGSGKSSLAFDTVYAEGQRRFMESMSTYAKRFVEQMKKPDVDFVTGLSPVISIEQKTIFNNPRSTVGTMTDLYEYLRMLYSTVGQAHCPYCRRPSPTARPIRWPSTCCPCRTGPRWKSALRCLRSTARTTRFCLTTFALRGIGGCASTASYAT